MVRLTYALFAALTLGACGSGAGTANASSAAETERPALFVANKRGNTLSKIDLESGEEILRRDSCVTPHELATSPDGEHVALACYGGTTVEIFATATLERVKTFELGANARPHGLVWSGRSIYVTAEGRQSIFAITYPLIDNPLDIIEIGTGQDGSHMLAVSPANRFAWTVDMQSGTVTLIDLVDSRKIRSAEIGDEPEGIALSPDGQTLWVSARGSNQAFALDPMTLEVRETVAVGEFPLRLAIRPQGDVAVTSNLMDGSLSVIDLNTAEVTRSIAVSSPETAQERFQVTILWSDDGSKIYVAETASNTVAEVDYASGTVLRRLSAGEGGDGLAILP